MDKEELCNLIKNSNIVKEWHWFGYNFGFGDSDIYSRFGNALVNSLLIIDEKINGYAKLMIEKIEGYSGKENDIGHYEQLLQICGEIYVLTQAVHYFLNTTDVSFENEPTSSTSKKNPEFVINFKGYKYGIEVKLPSLVDHISKRKKNEFQLIGRRQGFLDYFKNISANKKVTLPRDNPVKDFMESANNKFHGFKKDSTKFISILFILWDDFINEPIGALRTKPSGLLLEDSFAKKDGETMKFQNVDYIFLDRPLTNFIEDAAGRSLIDNKLNSFDYGSIEDFPHKIMVKNPHAKSSFIHQEILDCFQVKELSPLLGAEYNPLDLIIWIDSKNPK